ncbi:nuclear transport factor 2 family protein [Nitrincola sp. MINF-07-Sa-05]|uniref:nuclear transport factor 2 family protein n=1 Tax=Nitrincola salilacus TaxID=3400273 RepID=UPI003917C4D7
MPNKSKELTTEQLQRNQQTCARYAALFSSLTPERIAEFEPLVTPGIHFQDPFNDHHGFDQMRRVLEDMFRQTRDPGFEVTEISVVEDRAYLRWIFHAGLPVVGDLRVEGVSRLAFDEQGKVSEHIDYWDSAPIYLRLPVLGALLRRVRAKMGS